MPLYYLKPTSLKSSQGSWNLFGGAGSATTAVNDGTSIGSPADATYVVADRGESDDPAYFLAFNLSNPSIPSNEVIRRVRFAVRISRPSGANCDVTVGGKDPGGATFLFSPTTIRYQAAVAWVYGPWHTRAPDGLPWSKVAASSAEGFESINALLLRIRDFGFGGTQSLFREAWVEVETATQPSVTVSAPTGTIVSGRPLVTWSVTQAEGLGQTRAQVKVFSSAVYGAAGFNPETSTPSTLISLDGDAEWLVGDGYLNGRYVLPQGTFRAYVKADVFGSGDSDDYANWSPWAYSQFTVSNTPPPAPTVTATANNTTQAIDLTVTTRINQLSANDAGFESGIGSWVADTNASTIAVSAVHAADAAQSLRWTATAAGDTAVRTSSYPVTPGAAYRAVLDVRSGTSRQVRVDILWRDEFDVAISTSQGTASASATGSYGTRTVDATAPANARFARIRAYVVGAAAGEAHHIDKVGLWPGSTGTWTPGGMFDATITILRDGVTPVWNGTVRQENAPWSATPQTVTFADQLATRGVAHTYTAQVTVSAGQIQIEGTSGSATITPDTLWWLKPVTAPAKAMGGVRVVADSLRFAITEDVTEFRPLDSDYAVTYAGRIYPEDPTFDVNTGTPAEWADLLEVLTHQGVVLLQSPFGDHRFIRIKRRDWDLRGTAAAPRRKIAIDAVAVAEP